MGKDQQKYYPRKMLKITGRCNAKFFDEAGVGGASFYISLFEGKGNAGEMTYVNQVLLGGTEKRALNHGDVITFSRPPFLPNPVTFTFLARRPSSLNSSVGSCGEPYDLFHHQHQHQHQHQQTLSELSIPMLLCKEESVGNSPKGSKMMRTSERAEAVRGRSLPGYLPSFQTDFAKPNNKQLLRKVMDADRKTVSENSSSKYTKAVLSLIDKGVAKVTAKVLKDTIVNLR